MGTRDNAAKEFRIQIVCTTHSPIIIKALKNKLRYEIQKKGRDLDKSNYDCAIVYLEPEYDDNGARKIIANNYINSNDLSRIINDINLKPTQSSNIIKIYSEDSVAADFLQYILSADNTINLSPYMTFIDINLGWTNYLNLYEKEVPEFRNNLIVLDGDVSEIDDYKKKKEIEKADNILILPLVVEKDLFITLKNTANFNRFSKDYSTTSSLNYDICFNDWPMTCDQYSTSDFKKWYSYLTNTIKNKNILFKFWCDLNIDKCNSFIEAFTKAFNNVSDKMESDAIPNDIIDKMLKN